MTRRYPDPFGPPWKFPWCKLLCCTWHGGILQMFLFEWIVAITVCAICVTITYYARKGQYLEQVPDSLVALQAATTFVARRFQAAIALMLGFYSIQNFARWNQVRDIEGNVLAAIQELALRITWIFPTNNSANSAIITNTTTSSSSLHHHHLRHRHDEDDDCEKNIIRQVTEEEEEEEEEHDPEIMSSIVQETAATGITNANSTDNSNSIRKDDDDKMKLDIRVQLIRWINLAHAMVIGHIYENPKNAYSSLEKIRDCGLCTTSEYEFLRTSMRQQHAREQQQQQQQNQQQQRSQQSSYKYNSNNEKDDFVFVAPLIWFVDCLEQLKQLKENDAGGNNNSKNHDGNNDDDTDPNATSSTTTKAASAAAAASASIVCQGVTDGTISACVAIILTLRRQLADLYRFRSIPIPLSYRQLTNLTVRLYMVFLLFAAVLFRVSDESSLGNLTQSCFWMLLVFAFEYFLFVGWLTVADAVGNPFRCWSDELEWENYVKRLNAISMTIGSERLRAPSNIILAPVIRVVPGGWTGEGAGAATAADTTTLSSSARIDAHNASSDSIHNDSERLVETMIDTWNAPSIRRTKTGFRKTRKLATGW